MRALQALRQAARVTGALTAEFGAYGYATRRDLSGWARLAADESEQRRTRASVSDDEKLTLAGGERRRRANL